MSKYIWREGHWLELDQDAPRPKPVAPMIMRDVEPYRSVITREVIGGRRQHREHLRQHNCIEVGNEMPRMAQTLLPPVKHDVERAIQASPEVHAAARAASAKAARI